MAQSLHNADYKELTSTATTRAQDAARLGVPHSLPGAHGPVPQPRYCPDQGCTARLGWPRKVSASPAGFPFRPPPRGAASPRVPPAHSLRARAWQGRGCGWGWVDGRRVAYSVGAQQRGAPGPARKTPPRPPRCLCHRPKRCGPALPGAARRRRRPSSGTSSSMNEPACDCATSDIPGHAPPLPAVRPGGPRSPAGTQLRAFSLHFAKCPTELASLCKRHWAGLRAVGPHGPAEPPAPWRWRSCTSEPG